MIVVIADDITGAAEIGGTALRYGLKVTITDRVSVDDQADVQVVYTNTRSLHRDEAVAEMKKVTEKVAALQPELVYKKTDSVLRGHVIAELTAQMNVLKMGKALLVPANPSMGRIITGGQYYVNGKPINETHFATDPEFPILSSDVRRMLYDQETEVSIPSGQVEHNGITIGDAVTDEDMNRWARSADRSFLLAGGASFFNALLSQRFHETEKKPFQMITGTGTLIVTGTGYQNSAQRLSGFSKYVSGMPDEVFHGTGSDATAIRKWADEIASNFTETGRLIVTIGSRDGKKADPVHLAGKMSMTIKTVFEKVKVNELWIEGGATAYSILRDLGWRHFSPVSEISQGIVRMRVQGVEDLHVTIKPGSYDWPAELFSSNGSIGI